MKISSINTRRISPSECNNISEIIKKIYPEIRLSFFSEKPNVFDENYITGETRELAKLKTNEYFNKKI